MKTNTLSFALMLIITFAKSQDAPGLYSLPTIVPPSPTAGQIQRYGDYPVSHATGVPEISIPIYTIEVDGFQIPISISYHSGGIRPDETSFPIGLGWTLNAGGRVSRTVRGLVDERVSFPSVMKTESSINPITDHYYLYQLSAQYHPYDSYYDVFSYNLPVQGTLPGHFVLRRESGNFFPFQFPFNNYDITCQFEYPSLESFTIKDDKGLQYLFDGEIIEGYASDSEIATSSWLLTQITSPISGATIEFAYGSNSPEYNRFTPTSTVRVCDDLRDYGVEDPPFDVIGFDLGDSEEYLAQLISYNIQNVAKIVFPGGYVTFTYDASDMYLTKIEVFNDEDQIVKRCDLYQTDFFGQTVRKKLDHIEFLDKYSQPIERYSFEYYEDEALPNTLTTMSQDFWGYYNAANNSSLVPDFEYPVDLTTRKVGVGGGDRRTNESAMKLYSLKKIYYPTGGDTEFKYEANRYVDPNTNAVVLCGGLRITEVVSNDEYGHTTKKTYKYGIAESGAGMPTYVPNKNDYSKEIKVHFPTESAFEPTPGAPWGAFGCSGTYRVRIFSGSRSEFLTLLPVAPVYYSEVAEYIGDASNNQGKCVYVYNLPPNYSTNSFFGLSELRHYQGTMEWWQPSLLEKNVFRRDETGYTRIYQVKNTYDKFLTGNYLHGLNIMKFHHFLQYTTPDELEADPDHGDHSAMPFTYSDYLILQTTERLASSSETLFSEGSTLVGESIFHYDNLQHLYNTKTELLKSDQTRKVTLVSYPQDYASGTSFIDNMITNHVLNYPIEVVRYENKNNGTFILSGSTVQYDDEGKGLKHLVSMLETDKPLRLEEFKFSNRLLIGALPPLGSSTAFNADSRYKLQVEFSNYDLKGNILEVSKRDDQKISYIWGYDKKYPMAEVKNAPQDQIAYTSFETVSDKGGWTYSGTTSTASARTGNRSYRTTGAITRNLTTGEYRLVFWSQGQVIITGGDISLLSTRAQDAGTLYEYKVVVSSPVTLELTGADSNVLIDELRLCPQDAEMTTYTYAPLVGLTSVTDANEITTFYEYDSFGRLRHVMDDRENLLKEINYHYKTE